MTDSILPCRKCGSPKLIGPDYAIQWGAHIFCLECRHKETWVDSVFPETEEENELWATNPSQFTEIISKRRVIREWNKRAGGWRPIATKPLMWTQSPCERYWIVEFKGIVGGALEIQKIRGDKYLFYDAKIRTDTLEEAKKVAQEHWQRLVESWIEGPEIHMPAPTHFKLLDSPPPPPHVTEEEKQ
jgi:hypothetical protein